MKRILWLCLFLLGIPLMGQGKSVTVGPPSTPSRVAGRFVAYNYGLWSTTVTSFPAGTGSLTFSVFSSSFTLADGRVIGPYSANAPIFVGNETVTPTAIGSGCNIVTAVPSTCKITATFTRTHVTGEVVSSATYGLQEALDDAGAAGGAPVVVDSAWANLGGTSAMITAAVLPASSGVEDARNGSAQAMATAVVDGNNISPLSVTVGPSSNPAVISPTGAIWADSAAPGTGSGMARLGWGALASQTTGYSNTAVGHSALANLTTGTWNAAVGNDAMQFTTTIGGTASLSNTAVGSSSLGSSLDAQYDSAFGTNALLNNTTGTSNDCSGKDACWSISTGYQNTAHGINALTCSNGFGNVAEGYRAIYGLTSNSTGLASVAVGNSGGTGYVVGDIVTVVQGGASGGRVTVLAVNGGVVSAVSPSTFPGTGYALANNLTTTGGTGTGLTVDITELQGAQGCSAALDQGTNNVAVGAFSMEDNNGTGGGTGSNNTALGAYSLNANSTGADNAAVGINALQNNASGSNNVAMGNAACTTNVSGAGDICIGHSADVGSNGLNNAIAIGESTTVTTSDTAQIGNSSITDVYLGAGSATLHAAHIAGVTAPTGCAAGALQYPCLVGTYDSGALTAAMANQTLETGTAGKYRLDFYLATTQAGSTSGTLPEIQLNVTDADSSIATWSNITPTFSNPAAGATTLTLAPTAASSSFFNSSTAAIIVATANYASSGASPLTYHAHFRLWYLGP